MSKFIKYALAVATLLFACATLAFAADGDSVVATVNGQPYSSLTDALSASRAGDTVVVVANTSFSSRLDIPTGVNFVLPASVTISTENGSIYNRGNSQIYGTLLRTGSNASYGLFLLLDGSSSIYGKLVSSELTGAAVNTVNTTSPDAKLIIYGGRFLGFSQSVRASYGLIGIMGGYFDPPPTLSSHVMLLNGATLSGNAVSWGGMYELGQIVSESISWIGLFCAAIVANKLLLIFIIFVFGFVGLGLIKRMINS